MRRGGHQKSGGKAFWNREYESGEHLTLSSEPSENLVKFARFLARREDTALVGPQASALDLGCGNGRNLIHLAREYGVRGVGYDTSAVALTLALEAGRGLPLTFEERSIAPPLTLPDGSQTLVLDLMASHVLSEGERSELYREISRVLAPGGWLCMKTFLREGDQHAQRLLREYPSGERGTYIHPRLNIPEHVFTERELTGALSPYFDVHKIIKSYRHRGPHGKRRTICIYAQKSASL